MAQSNRDRVEKALQLLSSGLLPFIKRELKAVFGERWLYAVAESLDSAVVPAKESQLGDVAAQLKVMRARWKEVFSRTLGHLERSYVEELLSFRNKWAHLQPFTLDDTVRVLDDVQRLLTAVSAEEAIEAERQKEEVQRLRYEEAQRRPKKAREELALGSPLAGLKPWREVVAPHADVRSGRYQVAEFAADLAQVHRGEGSDEYRDPPEFFRRTFITQGLKQLLLHALQRLAGTGGDPVVELQTSFGGGKTHALLALYHLFSGVRADELLGVPEIMTEAGVTAVPQAARVVLVGTSLRPGQPETKPEVSLSAPCGGNLPTNWEAWKAMSWCASPTKLAPIRAQPLTSFSGATPLVSSSLTSGWLMPVSFTARTTCRLARSTHTLPSRRPSLRRRGLCLRCRW